MIVHGQRFHKNLIAVVPGSAPAHPPIGNDWTVAEGHIFNGRVLKQMALQGIFLASGRVAAPGLKNACFVKTHILSNHILGLNAHEQGHQDEKE